MRRWLLLLFLVTIAIDWPPLPFNARATDAAFIAAAIAILASTTWARPRLTSLDQAIAGYLGGSLVSMLMSPDPRAGAIEVVRQVYLVVIYGVIAIASRQGLASTIGSGLALSGGLLAAFGVIALGVQAIFGVGSPRIGPVMTLPYIGDTLRLRALTTSEAMFACVLAVSLPFVLLHPAIVASRARSWIAALTLALAAALTFSHSAAGVAASALVASWQRLRSQPALRLVAVGAVALVVLALNFAATVSVRSIGDSALRDTTVYHYAVDGGRAEIAGVAIDYQTMSYWRLKEVAWDAFSARPLTGIGLDRFSAITEIAFQEGRLTEPYRAVDPHSTLMGRLAETGLVGGATLIALWIVIAVNCRRLLVRDRTWIAVSIASALVGLLVASVNADVMNFRFGWVVLGLLRGRRDELD